MEYHRCRIKEGPEVVHHLASPWAELISADSQILLNVSYGMTSDCYEYGN
jgi:hypothetical protein